MNRYAELDSEALRAHLSGYLVDGWSYSGVSAFARNEKAFEMQYVYRERDRKSISSVAGNAYHKALRDFFSGWSPGAVPDPVTLTSRAYEYLDSVPSNDWKVTDRFPTAEAARAEAGRMANNLVAAFCAESGVYTDGMAEVLYVETRFEEWVTVNGVDIPLPLHAVIDLAARMEDGRVVLIDHKSVSAYTPTDEVALVRGQQAVAYVAAVETHEPSLRIAEAWFVENKVSRNKDGSPQLRKQVVIMDEDSRRLHEALLYEPLRRMCQAVGDPDYIYTVNTSDNFVDRAAVYDFWARTMVAEVDDFPGVPEGKRGLVAKRLRKIRDSSVGSVSPKVITKFRKEAASFIRMDYSNSDMTNEEKIEHVLRTHNIQVRVAHHIDGFSCDTYLCELAQGVSVASVLSHRMDVAYALDAPTVRIPSDLAVYEGRSYVAVEVNKKRERTLLWDAGALRGHRIPLGVDNYGRTVVWDLDNHSTPHLLVCGSTGSGKSVELISILAYAREAGVEDIIIFDPKYEFASIDCGGAQVYSDVSDIENVLAGLVDVMNERVRSRTRRLTLVIFDEFADAVDQSRTPKQLEEGEKTLMDNLKMLLQKGRSCGMRFCVATQRASTKVITGDIKVNIPVQVCFRVPKAVDSKVVLDEEGAQSLGGQGDGLIKSPEYQDRLVRFQGYFKS